MKFTHKIFVDGPMSQTHPHSEFAVAEEKAWLLFVGHRGQWDCGGERREAPVRMCRMSLHWALLRAQGRAPGHRSTDLTAYVGLLYAEGLLVGSVSFDLCRDKIEEAYFAGPGCGPQLWRIFLEMLQDATTRSGKNIPVEMSLSPGMTRLLDREGVEWFPSEYGTGRFLDTNSYTLLGLWRDEDVCIRLAEVTPC